MNHFTDMLSDAVLSKKLEACSLKELQSLSEKHPYSSALQLLYAKKLKEANDERYAKQLQQTLLYYKNPLLINHLIETDGQNNTILSSTLKNRPTTFVKEDFSSQTEDAINIDTPDSQANPSLNSDVNLENKAVDDKIPDNPQQGEEENTGQNSNLQVDVNITEESIESEAIEHNEEPLPDLPQFKIEAIDPAKAEFSFTPYYTVDYFAAQGIKLSDQSTNDRFGTQLKSFTDWLKHMKRLPGVNVKAGITAIEEKNIEKMAQHSLTGENANTEAMAEVWIKQGDLKKAIDIYKKLSLQIPRKSAYFAAKIDHLKK